MLEFLIVPLLAGLCIAVVAGALGTFVVWRKMSYFGDTLAHASLLGVVIGFVLQVNLYLALVLSAILIAILLLHLERRSRLSTDTLLGVIAHSALSFALVIISFIENLRVDLMSYLFGDLLSVTQIDLLWIATGSTLVCVVLCRLWKPFLAITISEDMAKIDGHPVEKIKLILILLVALVIAIAMKFIGALIITSLMIIPAATAKRLAKNPEQMAIIASILGCISVFLGIALSWYQDTPAGPSVVVACAFMFFISQVREPKN